MGISASNLVNSFKEKISNVYNKAKSVVDPKFKAKQDKAVGRALGDVFRHLMGVPKDIFMPIQTPESYKLTSVQDIFKPNQENFTDKIH